MSDELTPLRGLLNSVLSRLETLESKVGIETPVGSSAPVDTAVVVAEDEPTEIPPSVAAYDTHIQTYLVPFTTTCDKIGLDDMGTQLTAAWEGIRSLIVLGTKCKKPANLQTDLAPYLKPTQEALGKIQKMRLKRDFDWHYKAIMEMLVVCSWVMLTPPTTPTSFIKESIGSTDFWSNKIRKQYKGKDETQIAFCDQLKQLIMDLSKYTKEYHLSGLMFNPRGIPLSDYKPSTATPPKPPTPPAGGAAGVFAELNKKRTTSGDSAATGLRKVTKEQQTWRKEFKASGGAPPPPTTTTSRPAPAKKPASAAAPPKPPKCDYNSIQHKWIVENQIKESNPNATLSISLKDAKDTVYIYNCSDTTFTLDGSKVKTITMDKCTKCNLVFDTAISSCEVVNCKKIQIQVNGVCPSFSIDKTDGTLVFLSKESVEVSGFVTSKSTEMNVNWVGEDGDIKEAPIPEQFQHRFVNGVMETGVSDLYTH